ncbi:MAG: SPOR domain-containing protein [Deltaproteobacteria bacterium]|nr:SPOR domain-containing protein [Deltaproteobacteria bacterium]
MITKEKEEFSVGIKGLIGFIVGAAILMLFSFLLGVMVGMGDMSDKHQEANAPSVPTAIEYPKTTAGMPEVKEEISSSTMAKGLEIIKNESAGKVKNVASTKEAPKQAQPAGKKEYVVVYGTFAKKNNAVRLSKELVKSGFRARVASTKKTAKAMNAVISQPFDSSDGAAQLVKDVAEKAKNIKPFVANAANYR